MEKAPPEKSGSFASKVGSKKNDKNAGPIETGLDSIDLKSEDTEAGEGGEEKESLDSTISETGYSPNILDEEIDRFLSTLSTIEDKLNPPEVPEFVGIFLKLVESKIARYDSGESSAKFGQLAEEDRSFVDAVNRISKLTNALSVFPSDPKTTMLLNRTGSVLQQAMSLFEEEFRTLLEESRSSDSDQNVMQTKHPSFNSNHEPDHCILQDADQTVDNEFPGYSPEFLSSLKRIATAMISAGYETECCQVYSISRRETFDEALSKLGFEKISIDDVQKMQWESLEGEIATWIKVMKQCTTVLFIRERNLSESIFSEPSISRSLFSNLTRSVIIQLLNFAEAVAMTKRAAEKLFKFLDMYETLRDLIPSIEESYSECLNELKSEASATANRLGEATISIFCDLENSIKSDTGKTPVPSGAVHPLTRYTMNYLKYACEYKDTLEQVFEQHQKVDQSDSDMDQIDSANMNNDQLTTKRSPFSVQLITVMDLLDANLDAKSKLYRDPSLSYIFLMNNGRYILQKIKGSTEIHQLMGDTWCRKRSSVLRQYHKNYQRETWSKVLGCLRDEGLQVNGKVSKPVLKERFKSFNTLFDEIHRTQSTWVVSDEQLQSELRVSISTVVIPAYRSFLGRFRQYLDAGRQTEKYVKYQPEDIEAYVDELFDGNPTSMARKRT